MFGRLGLQSDCATPAAIGGCRLRDCADVAAATHRTSAQYKLRLLTGPLHCIEMAAEWIYLMLILRGTQVVSAGTLSIQAYTSHKSCQASADRWNVGAQGSYLGRPSR
jgi:hypothetical protein